MAEEVFSSEMFYNGYENLIQMPKSCPKEETVIIPRTHFEAGHITLFIIVIETCDSPFYMISVIARALNAHGLNTS